MNENIPIWGDPDVKAIYDLHDGQPIPRFQDFNAFPDQAELIFAFVRLDMENGTETPVDDYIEACLAGVRAVEGLKGKVHPGWIKFLLCQIDRNNSLLWDQYREPADFVAAIGEWLVTTIYRSGWGPDGNSTPLGQRHSNSMAVAAEAGGGTHRNPATGLMEYGDGSEARRLARVESAAAEPASLPISDSRGVDAGEADASRAASSDAWDDFAHHVDAANDGDGASEFIVQAAGAQAMGDEQLALELYERAAKLGEPQGMFESALIYSDRGDAQSARFWFGEAAGAGKMDAYGHLANLAEAAGDPQGEREWSRRGAEAGHGWSMGNYAFFLLMEAHQAVQSGAAQSAVRPLLEECHDYATRAADLGHVNAMYSAGLASVFLDRRAEALDWLTRAHQNGHADAQRMIQQFELG